MAIYALSHEVVGKASSKCREEADWVAKQHDQSQRSDELGLSIVTKCVEWIDKQIRQKNSHRYECEGH